MDAYQAILTRRSIRAYTDQPVAVVFKSGQQAAVGNWTLLPSHGKLTL